MLLGSAVAAAALSSSQLGCASDLLEDVPEDFVT